MKGLAGAFASAAKQLLVVAAEALNRTPNERTAAGATLRLATELDGRFMYDYLVRAAALAASSASQHGQAFAECLTNRRPLPGFTLARAGAESAGRAAYLLEPDIGARERLRRTANELLYATAETDRILVDTPRKILRAALQGVVGDEELDLIVGSIETEHGLRNEVLAWAELPSVAFHTKAAKGRNARTYLVDEHANDDRPHDTAVIERLIQRQSAGWLDGMAAGFFRSTSAVAHASAHGLAAAAIEPDAIAKDVLSSGSVDPLVVHVFGDCLIRLGQDLLDFEGLNDAEWDASAQGLRAVLPD